MLGGALEMPYLVLLARYAMCRLLIVFSDSIRYFSELTEHRTFQDNHAVMILVLNLMKTG